MVFAAENERRNGPGLQRGSMNLVAWGIATGDEVAVVAVGAGLAVPRDPGHLVIRIGRSAGETAVAESGLEGSAHVDESPARPTRESPGGPIRREAPRAEFPMMASLMIKLRLELLPRFVTGIGCAWKGGSPGEGRTGVGPGRLPVAFMRIAAMVGLLLAVVPCSDAEPVTELRVGMSAERLMFQLADDGGVLPWVLQSSRDGRKWRDLAFMERAKGGGGPAAELDRAVLPGSDLRTMLFRAVRLEGDDPFLREFLAARARWNAAGYSGYRYELRWNWSMFSWDGRLTVRDGVAVSAETVFSYPEGLDPLAMLSIDGWFDKIADARAQGAEVIEVEWHPELGYPMSGFIDVSTLIADEEQSWTIRSVAALR